MKKLTSGQLCRFIKSIDPDSIVERKNVRYFCAKENLDYTICQEKWLIDLHSFVNALNPKQYIENKQIPRLRTKISAQKEWNTHHRKKIKHYIIDCICNSGKVFVYKHGRHNIINYDQLEEELIKELKRRGQY